MDTRNFLDALFGNKPDELCILLWEPRSKRSTWFDDTQAAAEYAVKHSASDLYLGVALAPANAPEQYGEKRRCPAHEVAGIVGLWADVDFAAGGAHKKPNLPPTMVDALSLVRDMGLAPTIVVHSGHGLQAWWLFREPWVFDTPEERQEAARLVARWQATLQAKARERGWAVDSTHDLARVLRVVGTTNTKGDVPKRVKVQEYNPQARYNPENFEQYIRADVEAPVATSTFAVANNAVTFVINPQASPPFDKFNALMENDEKFRQTWHRQRKDLNDQSPSGYDIALATAAAMAGWSDQEIIDLIVAHRRHHKDEKAIKHLGYYVNTLKRARAAAARAMADDMYSDLSALKEEGAPADEIRQKALEYLSAMFGVRILRLVKYTSEPPVFRLETERGGIMLGGSDVILNQSQFRRRVFDATGVVIDEFKRKKWHEIAQAIHDACVVEQVGEDATERGQVREWLLTYLSERAPLDSVDEALEQQWPYVQNGAVYIFGSEFRTWLHQRLNTKLSPQAMGAVLRAFGCKPEVLAVRVDGGKGRSTRQVWRVNPDLVPEVLEAAAGEEPDAPGA